MKQILTIITLLISLSSYGQLVRIDSTWSSKRMYHTNHIGYRIGSDSIRTKDVRATLDGGDTFHIITDSLVSRIVYRFITTDSLSPYLRKDQNDTVTTYQTVWKDGAYEMKVENTRITATDGTATFFFQPTNMYIGDGMDLNGLFGYDNAYLYNGSSEAKLDLYSNHMTIDRAGYSATGSNEVPIVSEVKAFINDSLDTRLAAYTPNSDLEEKIQDQIGLKLVEGSNVTITYNDATGETTLDAAGGSGLSAESVFDTVAYTIRMGEGLTKTKSDTGDSLYIEMKLRDVERLAYTTASHKLINMASNTTTGGTTLGASWSLGGTNTAITKATTNLHNFMNRAEILKSPVSTTNVATIYGSTYTHGFGNASGMGGFYYVGTWGPTTGCSNTTHRGFFGFRGSVSLATDVDPSTLTNVFGIAWDDDDTNVQFMHNDGTSTCTKVDLGSGFPVATADRTNVYRLFMYAEPNTTTVYYKVIDMTDGDTYVGSATTNLPSNTQMFAPCGIMSVGGTSALCGVSLFQLEIFSDF